MTIQNIRPRKDILLALALALSVVGVCTAQTTPPDLTASGVIAGINRAKTYNLGPTGLRGWIHSDTSQNNGATGRLTHSSRQILVTVASSPGNAVLAVDDVILGAIAASSGTVPSFTSDARKAFGAAITEAEKTGAGTLRVKRWRGPSPGTTTEENITIPTLGEYLATAPYNNCPKSTAILNLTRNQMVGELLANTNYLNAGQGHANAINALALLASVQSGDPNFSTVQTRLQTYARSLSNQIPSSNFPNQDAAPWVWGPAYQLVFLSEYYLLTNDSQVVTTLNAFSLWLAEFQSMWGTYNHGPAHLHKDGSGRRISSGYGPVNACGNIANIALVLGKKALLAASQPIDPKIDTAIQRGAGFLGSYVNKGTIPYGEHEPWMGHESNGKNASAAVLFGIQNGRAVETEYFSRLSVAGWIGVEAGHAGQELGLLWSALGAAMGGDAAASAHFRQLLWRFDLTRRSNGSFTYDSNTDDYYQGGATANGTYLGDSSQNDVKGTAIYLLTYSLPLKRLYITGKQAPPAYTLDAAKITNAVSAASFRLDRTGLTIAQLFAALGEYDPVVRYFAAVELAARSLSGTELTNLRALLSDPDPNIRKSAAEALGIRTDTTALPTLVGMLHGPNRDPDHWVRQKVAAAIRKYPASTVSTHRDALLTAFFANAPADPNATDWTDPLQFSNSTLADVLFNQLADYTVNAPKTTHLYPAVRAGLMLPTGYYRTPVATFARERLNLADLHALYPELVFVASYDSTADRMFSAGSRASALGFMAEMQITESLPLAIQIIETHGEFAKEYLEEALRTLVSHGDAARYTLPSLRNVRTAWNERLWDGGLPHAALADTITFLENATSSTPTIPGKSVANDQIVTTTGAMSVTLTGASPRGSFSFLNVTNPANGTLTGTAPNLTYTPNGGFTGTDKFTFQTQDSLTTSDPATVSIIVGSSGNGIAGAYFDTADFTGPALPRTDAQINFDWGTGSPAPSIGADTFSTRWSGYLLVPETGTYTLSGLTSDGFRAFLNGVPVINNLNDQDTRWTDGLSLSLTAGQKVPLYLEYYENTGSAVAKLKWTGPSFAGLNGDIVPQAYLFENNSSGGTDSTPPVISALNPADNATGVAHAADLVATFSENIVRGTGNITIKNLSDGTQTVIPVTDTTQVTVAGATLIINPTALLPGSKNFAVQIDATAIDDTAGNSFAGIAIDTTWNFSTTAPDTTKPTPNPMTFAVPPVTAGSTSISMTATTASDPSGVEYRFNNLTLGTSSAWQTSPVLTATGLAPSTNYIFTVQARDKSVAGNTTTASAPASARTLASGPLDVMSVNFYFDRFGAQDLNTVTLQAGELAGLGAFRVSGWQNYPIPWGMSSPAAPFPLTSSVGATASMTLNDARNGWTYRDTPHTFLAGSDGDLMGAHANGTEDPYDQSALFNMDVSNITYPSYDLIVYLGANEAQFGDGTGKIVINGGAPQDFTLRAGEFSSYIEITDATTPGNYIVFRGLTNPSLSLKVWGNGFNHIGPAGFQIVNYGAIVADTTPPVISTLSPTDNATGVSVGDNLVATFSENIAVGTGNITVKNLTDGTQTDIAATDTAQVSVSGAVLTINPTADLLANKNYAVQIAATAIDDTAGNSFAGVANDTTWNFATVDTIAPTISSRSPADNSTGIFLDTNMVATFSEPIVAGSGNITIRKVSGNSLIATIAVTDGTQITISGNVLTINPTANLAANTEYAVRIANTCIDDLAGNSYGGIGNNTSWSFTTGTATADTTAPTPNPMTFASPPAAVDSTSISMTASTASDTSGVEYRFTNVTLGTSSPWQDGTAYTATGLSPATPYSFTVQARDKSPVQNTTAASTSASATTQNSTQPADRFNVNLYSTGEYSSANFSKVTLEAGESAGVGSNNVTGWQNISMPFGLDSPMAPVPIASSLGLSASFTLNDVRNGWTHDGSPNTNVTGGNADLMNSHGNGTEDPYDGSMLFDMALSSIPFNVYDLIVYVGGNAAQYGDGTAKYVINGGPQKNFTLPSGEFAGFDEITDASPTGNYVVFKGLRSTSLTFKMWGNGFNHIGPTGFQIVKDTTGLIPPGPPSNPGPVDGSVGHAANTDLSWTGGLDATSRNVYFGTSPTPGASELKGNQSATTYDPGNLANGTYYWRIDEVNADGTTPGPVWSFSVGPPSKAYRPLPWNGMSAVATNVGTLKWVAGASATTSSSDVYFGTDSTPDSTELKGNQTTNTYNPGTLLPGTTYYWRIDQVNAQGTTTGDVWSFTTPISGSNKVKVFILAGQSNMEGQGEMSPGTTPGTLQNMYDSDPVTYAHLKSGGNWAVRSDVWAWFRRDGGALQNGGLTAGYGSNTGTIGPELQFGHIMGDHFGQKVLLIKAAWGGKSLRTDFRPPSSGWSKDVPVTNGDEGYYFKVTLDTVVDVLANLQTYFPTHNAADGYEIAGFGWHQGWNDRVTPAFSAEYEVNMANFIRDVRSAVGVPAMPFVIGTTGMGGDAGYTEVELAQLKMENFTAYPAFNGNVAVVDTKPFWFPVNQSPADEGYHWNRNAKSYYNVGQSMAQEMRTLIQGGGTNTAPVANAQSVTTAEDTAKAITLTGTDAEGNPLTYTIVSQPASGTLSGTAPNVTYTPAANSNGPDSFTFKVNDGGLDSAPATVSITVTAVNDVPVATAQAVTTAYNTAKAITLAGTDVENSALSYAIVTNPANGTLGGTAPNVTYTPAVGFSGPDSFTFKVNDGSLDSAPATVSITVGIGGQITWGSAIAITSASDIQSSGLRNLAGADFGRTNGTTTVVNNGSVNISFISMLSSQSAVLPNGITVSATGYNFNVDTSAPAGVTGAYRTVMTKQMGVAGGTGNIILNGLTIGTTYQVQFYITGSDANTSTISGSPSLAAGGGNSAASTAGFGKYIVGTFTADATSKTFVHTANTNEPVVNALTIGVVDAVPPTLSGNSIVDNRSGGPVTANTLVTYTVTFSEDMDASSVSAADFGNAGTSAVTIGTVSETSPGVFTVPVTPTNAGTLQLRVNAGAVLNDAAGNPLNTTTAITDDTTLTVTPPNTPPVANAQSVTTDEDTALSITLAGNDADGNPLTYTVVTQPAIGTLSGTAPNVIYTPATNYNGPASFTFKVNDGAVDSTVATISITVTPVNDVPTANAQSVTTAEDTAKVITLTGSDIENSALTYTVVAQPANGTLSGTAPNVTYTPAANYNGPDSFTFKVNDGTVDSSTATVSITVTALNDVPVANAQGVTTDEDTAKVITLTGSDIENSSLAYTIVTQPASGTLSGTAPNVTYTPAANYNGPDSFTFKVNDGTADSSAATVSITVTALNDAPVANAQSVTTDEDTAKVITLTGSDIENSALTYTVVAQPANGTLSGTAPNVTYTPAANYNGPDSFTFKVNDGTADSSVATVSITVTAVNDTPVANAQSVTTDEDTAKAITLTGSDAENSALTYTVVTQPVNGTLSGTESNLIYTPAANYHGPASFTFKCNDGTEDSPPATVSITVTAVNDAPAFTSNPIVGSGATQGVAYSGSLAGSATDSDQGDTLTFSKTSGPEWLTLASNGTLGGSPGSGDTGLNEFTVRVTDGGLLFGETTLRITVLSDYASWAGNYPGTDLSDPNGDADGDGLTNNEERLWGLNPTSGASVGPISSPINATTGTFSYTRRNPTLSGATYSYQSTETLAGNNWAAFTPANQSSNAASPVETVQVTLPAPLLGKSRVFVRVVATPASP